MRNLVTLVAAAALLVPSLVLPTFGHAKPLPPAFGNELVPEKQSQESDVPKEAEIDEPQDRRNHPVVQPGRHGQPGQKLHIELDGSEDGDDDEDGGEDGGEF
jgi:hypothetical protein